MFVLTYRKPIMVFVTFAGLTMLFSSIFYFIGFKIPMDNPPYYQLATGFGTVILVPFSIYRSAKKNFTTYGRLQEKIFYEFTQDQIKISGETFNSEFSWDKTYKILELNNWILIYQNRIAANIIPKESFGENLDEFKRYVKNKPRIKNNFSPVKKIIRILLISLGILPFLLIGIVYFFSKAEPEEFIIPNDYQGEVLVFFEQHDGAPIKYSDGKRIYEIPDDGILFTQFKWNVGFSNRRFYFLTDGKEINIDEVGQNYSYEQGKPDSDMVSVMNKGPYFYKSADGINYLFRAHEFIVANRKSLNNYSMETKMDSIIETNFN